VPVRAVPVLFSITPNTLAPSPSDYAALPLLLSVMCTIATERWQAFLDAAAFEERLDGKLMPSCWMCAPLLSMRQWSHRRFARNLDQTSGQLAAAVNELEKSKPVLLYCASGRRSAHAARLFLVSSRASPMWWILSRWDRRMGAGLAKPIER
jgi:hypothetical protein